MYVLDSSVLIELLNEGPQAVSIRHAIGEELLVTTSISAHEVLCGAASDKHFFLLENLFSSILVLGHDEHSAKIGAVFDRQLTRAGAKINTPDLLIAGICKVNNAELVTLDQDFAKIKGLKATILGKRNA